MNESYEVIDRETGKTIVVRSLYDSNGGYKPHDPVWQASYQLRNPVTHDEIVIAPATATDKLRDIADRFQILAEELHLEADRMDDE